MTREELLRKYNQETYEDYVKHYLIGHWQKESERGNWRDLVTNAFATRHGGEGTVTTEQARDVSHLRSAGGQNDFTSTTLSEDDLVKIVRDISKNGIIQWHCKNNQGFTGGFANYELSVIVRAVTVQVFADKGFKPNQDRVNVVVGINHQGLICHYHGEAEYADGTIYHVDEGTIKKRDK